MSDEWRSCVGIEAIDTVFAKRCKVNGWNDMRRIDTLEDIAEGLEALLQTHPELAAIAERAGPLPLRRSEPGFESLASVIVSQQVSKASAASIWNRLVKLIDPLTPENYLAAGEEAWRLAGLSRAKQATLCPHQRGRSLPENSISRPLRSADRGGHAAMTSVKGIGPWTAEVYLLFSAGHAGCLPVGRRGAAACLCPCLLPNQSRPDSKALRLICRALVALARCCGPTFLGLLRRNPWPRWHTNRHEVEITGFFLSKHSNSLHIPVTSSLQ